MKYDTLQPVFVTGYMPKREDVEEGRLYICKEYGTVLHKCACGCGAEVYTPIDIGDKGWVLREEGELVTLTPSVGNQQLACRTHYNITANRVVWHPPFA